MANLRVLVAKLILILPILSLFIGCGDGFRPKSSLGFYTTTVYILALEQDYTTRDQLGVFLDKEGRVLHRGSREFYSAGEMNGSVRLRDGRVLTVDRKVGGQWRWAQIPDAYGRGALCPMIPYRTLAVDPEQIALGSILYIEETRGLLLPDGSVHDGIWYAVDTGGAIRDMRIDLFAGAGESSMGILMERGLTQKDQVLVEQVGKISACPI